MAPNPKDYITTIGSHDPDDSGEYLKEVIVPGLNYEIKVNKVHLKTKSPFQEIQIIDTCFGKTLLTDGLTQSTQVDEFIYSESLVHPALVLCAQRRKQELATTSSNTQAQSMPKLTVLIGGGGELATAREVLKYPCVEKVVMVEIDSMVVDVSRKYLPEWGGDNVYNDPRLELIIGDAYEYVAANTPRSNDSGGGSPTLFDAIIMDISDPVEAGPGFALYTKEFFELASKRLKPSGVIVTQAGMAEIVPASSRTSMNCHYGVWSSADGQNTNEEVSLFGPLLNTLKSVFDESRGYTTNIPSFGGEWAFALAFNHINQNETEALNSFDPSSPSFSSELVDEWLEQLLSTPSTSAESIYIGHYDGQTHSRMFLLPKPLRNYLKTETRTMTKDDPIYLYNG
mmetsp:Transcript_22559/g.62696  ORF Transcript_22559/g.62696 Transcript_22559/m.62696 type:complete len:398 (-) Transcript_22559:1322-2515(-)|eukprot:CAMPEP_0168728538 /NCGR_PEP_ID=MMETSP0724-20121128/5734_1 /TAXON_ID=265536 /ORGANISM="Amphiprora sp., Strain CCMP467" /LENGTH=397 /DNA_ID=CAMNT_0008775383 /DNA_START=177 /DNA_END=1370 /DNA_ORIENTATION=-